MDGQVNVVGQMMAQNFAQGIKDTGGKIDYLGTKDNIIDIKPKLYALGAHPYPWDTAVGTEIPIDPACLSGCGATKTPIRLINNGEILVPASEQPLYSAYAPYSSYVAQITGDANNSAVAIALPGGNPKIPAGLIYLGAGIRVVVTYKHAAGASNPYFRVLFGNSQLVGSASILIDGTADIGNELTFDAIARITTLGGGVNGRFLPHGTLRNNKGEVKQYSGSSSAAFVDKVCRTDSDFYVLLACFPNSQTINIQKLQVSIVP